MLHPVQIDHVQHQRVGRLPFIPVTILHQKVAQIKVAMIQPVPMNRPGDGGHLPDEFALKGQSLIGRQAAPVLCQLLQRNHPLQRLGDHERFLMCGSLAADAAPDHVERWHPQRL